MKVLVTGSNGLLGSEVVKWFDSKAWEVIGIDSNMRSYFFGVEKQTPMVELDIRDQESIFRLFDNNKFDAVINCAAQPSHDWAKKDPLMDFDINARGTLILLEATRKHCPNAVFIQVSTDKVYGENMKRDNLIETETRYDHETPFDESTPLDQSMHSLFGCSKAAADLYAQEYAYYFGMKVGVFRPGCITGSKHKGAEEHGFLSYLVKCIKEEKPYKIFGYKGKQVRDQIHAEDLARAFYAFVLNPKSGVYNIGGGRERSVSILEAINLIEEQTNRKAIIEYVDQERKGDRQWDIHDISKFRKEYPEWEFNYSLNDILKDLCK